MEFDVRMILFLPVIYYLSIWMDPYNAWAITLIMAYCIFLFIRKKRLSIWSFLIIGFGIFILRILASYYLAKQNPYAYHLTDHDVAEALTEVLYCIAKFLLIWGTLSIVRKTLNKRAYFVQRRNLKAVIYLAVLTFFFYFHFAYEYVHVVHKPYVYQKMYDFWLSVIPEFRL